MRKNNTKEIGFTLSRAVRHTGINATMNVARGFAIIAPRIKVHAKLQTLAAIETTKDED